MSNWTTQQIPDLSEKIAIVTGANSGLGLQTAKVLASKGCKVILACRNETKANQAKETILKAHPNAHLQFIRLDLADLKSIQNFCESFTKEHNKLDLLINNAGIMNVLEGRTADGFERQFGTNHLGHFALTARLFPQLKAAAHARVVTTSSLMHHPGEIYFDNINLEGEYGGNKAYSQSKLANLLFALELHRRLEGANLNIISNATHPGWTSTNLQYLRANETKSTGRYWMTKVMNALAGMPVEKGALPNLFAATAPEAKGGEYYGPSGFMEIWGGPGPSKISQKAKDLEVAKQLWTLSEELVNLKFIVK